MVALAAGDLVLVAVGRGPDADRAWRLLVERHASVVWKVVRCFGLPEEASWEAYQGAWLRAIERLDTLRDPACFAGWLGTIARHEALAVSRARRKVVPSSSLLKDAADDGPAVGEQLQRDELCRAVREGFASLAEGCQDLLRLLTADPPIPYSEIEELLATSHGSIGPTRRRCLDKLRKTAAMVAYLESGI
jgi:RNA polymerase sigma factor (sigma-70 family)